ncbi:hypothetical protein FRC0061_00744 [Corynebacterium diphtheriae]|nr:hypothetical protein FRC0061_00744 [Corynebacterium diphtheriae]
MLALRGNVALEGSQAVAHVSDGEVVTQVSPRRVQVLVSKEIAQVVTHQGHGVSVGLNERIWQIFRFSVVIEHELLYLVGQELIEDEAEDVVLVLIGLNFGAHIVGRLPDAGGKFLFVHGVTIFTKALTNYMDRR